jgi:hypothetical protein
MTKTINETLKLALEALEWCQGGEPCGTAEAIAAIKAALAQPEQEPVGQVGEDKHGLVGDIYDDRKVKIGDKLYTSLPQRQWVGLTVDELIDLERKHLSHENLTKAIEAKLKEKNT